MKYVITGGAGFIGSHLVEALSQDHEVVVVDNLFSGKCGNIMGFPVEFEYGSITDLNLLTRICEGSDGVFHQAAITSVPRSVKNPIPTNEVNIGGTLNVLIAARDAGVKKVVFASSSSVYGDTPTLPKYEAMVPYPLSPYGVSKLTGEHYCRVFHELYGLQTVSLRYFNVFGPRQDPLSEYSAVIPKFITKILRNESPVIYGDGTQTRDFTYVKDVVRANLCAMESDTCGVYNVAYNQQLDLNTLAMMIMDCTGYHVPIEYEPVRSGDIRDSRADFSLAQKELHYSPEYTVRSGLEETIQWYQNQ